MVGQVMPNCAPRTCAACLTTIEEEPIELRDYSGGHVYVHDLHCALSYERMPRARLPWQTQKPAQEPKSESAQKGQRHE